MGTHRSAVVAGAVAVAMLALAGCGAPPMPAPATEEEIQAIRQQEAQSWWDSMSTGTTMPEIEVIAELPMEKASAQQTQCLLDSELPGVTVIGPGQFSYESPDEDDAADRALQVQWFICAQQYPIESEHWWILSSAQLAWLYDYFDERYIPCLHSTGREVLGFPTREQFLATGGGYPAWLPYEGTVEPSPGNRLAWQRLAQRCPLPEMVQEFGLPGSID